VLRSVFAKTLHDHRRSIVWWLVGLIGLAALYVLVYPTVRDRPELNRLLEDYPELLRALIGGGAAIDLTSPAGYLSTEVFSLMAPLVLLVFAIGLGAAAIAGEEERRTLDLLLAAPLSRTRLVLEKTAAIALLLVVLGVGLWVALLALAPVVDMDVAASRLGAAVTSTLLLGLHFGTLALLVGCATGRRGLSIGVAAGVAILAYAVNALGLLVDFLEPYRKFSPWFHYIGGDPLRSGLAWDHVMVLLGASAGMVVLAVLAFSRRDVRL
jgi:ABC-2 type transport system permease protein